MNTTNRGINDGVLEEIRVALARRRMNQSALADAMNESRLWVSRRMRGEVQLTLTDLGNIAEALDCPIRELLPQHVILIGAQSFEPTRRTTHE